MGQSVDISSDLSTTKGVVTTTNTTAVTGNFYCIVPLEDTVFAAFTEVNGVGSFVGKTIPAGVPIYGLITGYTLASGSVRAYKA